jgi:hypothetical protein
MYNPSIRFSNKQADYLDKILTTFITKASDRDILGGHFLMLLGSIRDVVASRGALEPYEIDTIKWVLDLLVMELDQVDIELEKLYHKITGWYPIDPPYFELLKAKVNYDD